ncbi:T9SS type A sorting domain-containing protein, partial [Segetibacter sp. 3557_3]|uniref:T9SS type A sorting domain-containing protein n=1 Tax=Segetibacter sp. 3557_3 TaxID=2547429 RepID=UPI0010585BC4
RQTPAYLAGSFKYVGASTDATDKIVTITARDISGNSSRVAAHVFVRYKGAACITPEPLTNIMNSFSLNNDMSLLVPNAITVFPNPSTGEFKVRFMVPESGITTIQLQDEHGKKVKHKTIYTSKGSCTETFHVRGQPSGMYIIRICSKTGIQTGRLVLQHQSK